MLSIFLTNIHIDMLIFFQFYAANSLLRGEIRVMERQKKRKNKEQHDCFITNISTFAVCLRNKSEPQMMKRRIITILKKAGIPLMCIGALLIGTSLILAFLDVDHLLTTGTLMIIGGAVLFVWRIKSESKY